MAGTGPVVNKAITFGVEQTAYAGSGTPTYTDIPQVVNLAPPSEKVDDNEVTVYSSDGKEYLPGMYDGGEVTLTINFNPSIVVHNFIRGLPAASTVHAWQAVIPGVKEIAWVGYVNAFTPNLNKRGEVVSADVTIKVTGVPTYTDPEEGG